MKEILITILCVITMLLPKVSLGQEEVRGLKPFTRIVVSPLVDIVLIKGTSESITLDINNVSLNKVNTIVRGNTLRVFLDGAKFVAKKKRSNRDEEADILFKRPEYVNTKVIAYVTYVNLESLEFRGEGVVKSEDMITTNRFKLKVYGDSKVELAGVQADRLKVAMYGDNSITINGGGAKKQVFAGYGGNSFDGEAFFGEIARTTLFGENSLRLNVEERIHITSFGESDVYFRQRPRIRKGIVLGDTDLHRIR